MPRKKAENIAFGVNTENTYCKVFDSNEILTSPEEIDYYKSVIKEFEATNRLLGEINDEGEYVISEKIRRDLALLPKELTQNGFNLVEAWSHVTGKDLFFYIEIQEEEGNQIASLYLVEKVEGYRDVQSLKSFVAKIVQPKSDDFQDKARRVLNVQDVLFTIDEGKFMPLVMQVQDRIDYWIELEDIAELTSQIYVLRMLSLLEGQGELGKKVIEEYNRQVKREGLDDVKIKKRYLGLRKLLDKAIETYGGTQVVFKDKQEQVKEIKKEFTSPIKKVEEIHSRQPAKASASKKPEKAPAKEESKPSKSGTKAAGKKAAAKKENKGGGKKAGGDKKKDDKKEKKEEKKPSGGGSSSKGKTSESVVKKSSNLVPPTKNPENITLIKGRHVGEVAEEDDDEEMDAKLRRIASKGTGEKREERGEVNGRNLDTGETKPKPEIEILKDNVGPEV